MTKPKDLDEEELGEHPITEREVIGQLMRLIINVEGWIKQGLSEAASNAITEARRDGWREMGWSDLMKRDRDNKNEKDKIQPLIQWLIRYQENPLHKDFKMNIVIFDVYKEITRLMKVPVSK